MVYSLTPFFNELDVLEIRLAELDPVVDVHVIAEMPITHTGRAKPLYFQANRERFQPWRHKIRHIVVEDYPEGGSDWLRENHQRDALSRGLEGLEPDDLVLLSDVDEIPRRTLVEDLWDGNLDVVMPLHVSFPIHLYRLDWRWPNPEPGFTVCRFFAGELATNGIENLRKGGMANICGECGWHFAYMGDEERISTKIDSIADEWVKREAHWRDPEHLRRCIETGKDLFGRSERQCERVPLENLPEHVQQNPERFAHLLVQEPVAA